MTRTLDTRQLMNNIVSGIAAGVVAANPRTASPRPTSPTGAPPRRPAPGCGPRKVEDIVVQQGTLRRPGRRGGRQARSDVVE